MKKIRIIAGIIIAAGLANACSSLGDQSVDDKEERDTRPVKVEKLTKDSVDREISYTANLVAFEELYFAPSQPGRINQINVEAGDRVQKNQVLVKMDQTQLTQALLQVQEARKNFRRMDTLRELNSISEQQYDQAKTQYEIAQSNLKHLRENTSLKAPFNGIVTEKYFEAGEIYSGTPNTQMGKPAIITLMQISPLKAIVNISEKYFPNIKKGMKAIVHTDIYPDKNFQGQIFKVYPTINPATRAFKVEIKVDNPKEILRPGMFARVHINLKDDVALLAPAIAIIKQEGTNNRHVFIHKNGKAHKVPVKIGKRYNDKIEIVSDKIQRGDDLIVSGQANLIDGDRVTLHNQ
ncbi:MAG: efflux RND transporter periplasmic adaptor subunit [Bacteroidales bacterium]|nr:efflux RND transporter periplasmic adaptor subunit [Bacteroidales bacterium]MCF8327987.1 efflux RND transporter periplasmic adaptor subunit [Bacteroidales bacterium]